MKNDVKRKLNYFMGGFTVMIIKKKIAAYGYRCINGRRAASGLRISNERRPQNTPAANAESDYERDYERGAQAVRNPCRQHGTS